MRKNPIKLPVNLALVCVMLTGVIPANAQEFRYGKGVQPENLLVNGKKTSRAQFEAGMSRQIMKFQRSSKSKDAGLNLTSVNVVEDCSASITCGDGTKIECSVQGPGTCESGMVSVACITATTSEHSSCPVN